MIEDDECIYYQDGSKSACVNGTLQVLSLPSNNLNGLLPNEIALLSKLEVLNMADNQLRGKIPNIVVLMKELK